MRIYIKLLSFLFLLLISVSASAIVTNDQVFAYVAANYPTLFTGTPTSGTYSGYDYKYYPVTGNYIGINNGGVYLLGPVTGGSIKLYATVSDLTPAISQWEVTNTAPALGAIGATGPQGLKGASSGYVLLDAKGNIIGNYDFMNRSAILEINQIYYALPVDSSGFKEINNIFSSTAQTYFTSTDCSGTAYYRDLDRTFAPPSFPNRENYPIVFGNKIYKEDLSQVISITAMSMHSPGYTGTTCGNQNPDLYGGRFLPTQINVVTPSALILIEDFSIYPTPFSITAN